MHVISKNKLLAVKAKNILFMEERFFKVRKI
jgi:hypothetical protein